MYAGLPGCPVEKLIKARGDVALLEWLDFDHNITSTAVSANLSAAGYFPEQFKDTVRDSFSITIEDDELQTLQRTTEEAAMQDQNVNEITNEQPEHEPQDQFELDTIVSGYGLHASCIDPKQFGGKAIYAPDLFPESTNRVEEKFDLLKNFKSPTSKTTKSAFSVQNSVFFDQNLHFVLGFLSPLAPELPRIRASQSNSRLKKKFIKKKVKTIKIASNSMMFNNNLPKS